MYSTVTTGAISGICAYMVCVEVDMATGLPCFNMVGSLSNEVRESKERVVVALKNNRIAIPPMRVTVNLSPADHHKEGTAFDLPIAIGLLQAMGIIHKETIRNSLFLGELGLNGEVKKVRGVLPIVKEAAACGLKQCFVPLANAMEGAVIPGIDVRGVSNLQEIIRYLNGNPEKDAELPVVKIDLQSLFEHPTRLEGGDFKEIMGQTLARRGAEIAAAGFHNLLMVGPPGAGKTMIAKRIPGIMPPLTIPESLEVTSVLSVAGLLKDGETLATNRPFLAPHHTIPMPSMIGGRAIPKPGIISQAHRGVLFLDEMPEFSVNVLNSLRQPLEEGTIQISRMGGNVVFPANFILIGAMNPCPCGYYPNLNKCKCTEPQIKRYQAKISGPILDRMDLAVWLNDMDFSSIQHIKQSEDSESIRRRVLKARQIQKERFGSEEIFNKDMSASQLEQYCRLEKEEKKVVEIIYQKLTLSARGYHRLLRVARTIADLSEEEQIKKEHLLEAASYRISWQGEGK